MTDILAVSLHGMQQDMARVERIGLNLANAATPGYKREVAGALPTSSSFADQFGIATDAATAIAGTRLGDPTLQPGALLRTRIDLRPGMLKATGQPLDVALTTPGFFEVDTDAGAAYTRQGDFRLDPRGRLVTAQGYRVMGEGGEIVLSGSRPRIDASGQVFDERDDGRPAAAPVARLKVVGFGNPEGLERVGNGVVRSAEAPTQQTESEVRLRQGHLESSNVDPMAEMVRLIETLRHFESMQRVATSHDEMLGSAIRRLGDLN